MFTQTGAKWPEKTLSINISIFYKDFQKYCEEKLKPFKLTPGLYNYLLFIYYNPGCNLNEISTHLKVDKALTTKTIKKLLTLGYVDKLINEYDNRAFKVYPTKNSINMMEYLVTIFEQWEEKITANLSTHEVNNFNEFFLKTLPNLNR
ncbi:MULTISPECIES: MarR family winged helix-turn-helix transcriptional regulator [Clostridium]|uniref:Winged helix-turn-helix transcriptional regulator n=1 Tax=Clostridium senegalense TaxID=1465809 RepID=A0A6M0HA12_9CLOT|nr:MULTISPECIES: MarR family winged helix-turn-helix transcriptional regulator [Clostridium]NEU06512.1 winged helix-turn-helix transcriptional regulator [Clostridium senegalense]